MSLPYRYLSVNNARLAMRTSVGRGMPAVLWLSGFRSDISGLKACALFDWAEKEGRAYRCFDYFAHGASEGEFEEFTLSRAIDDALHMIEDWKQEKLVLAGSSMGAWVALRVLQILDQRGEAGRICGLVLVAPAPDFTEKLMWEKFPPDIQNEIMEKGSYRVTSKYAKEPYPITRALIEDGATHLLLGQSFHCPCPVRILHGTNDQDVPWQHAVTLMNVLEGNATLSLIRDGDHRLSTDENLAELIRTVKGMG